MSDSQFDRRRLLRATGTALAVGLAGCANGGENGANAGTGTPTTGTGGATETGSSAGTEPSTTAGESTATANGTATEAQVGPTNADDLPADENPEDGFPPRFEEVPDPVEADPTTFDTVTTNGVEVPLVPIDVAYNWYARREARFADARGQTAYKASHIFGAVLSPAPDGQSGSAPVASWPTSDRVITYCACPHHLSSMRAASLIDAGYERVYAIDEGFLEWQARNYPTAGEQADRSLRVRTVAGETDPAHAGETAWAFHHPSGQREATRIGAGGGYELDLPFVDVTDRSRVTVRTPGYTVAAPLGQLTRGFVTADGAVAAVRSRNRIR